VAAEIMISPVQRNDGLSTGLVLAVSGNSVCDLRRGMVRPPIKTKTVRYRFSEGFQAALPRYPTQPGTLSPAFGVSYVDLGCQDSNLEPSDPESDVLPVAPQPNRSTRMIARLW
jgi:hypothetical protein